MVRAHRRSRDGHSVLRPTMTSILFPDLRSQSSQMHRLQGKGGQTTHHPSPRYITDCPAAEGRSVSQRIAAAISRTSTRHDHGCVKPHPKRAASVSSHTAHTHLKGSPGAPLLSGYRHSSAWTANITAIATIVGIPSAVVQAVISAAAPYVAYLPSLLPSLSLCATREQPQQTPHPQPSTQPPPQSFPPSSHPPTQSSSHQSYPLAGLRLQPVVSGYMLSLPWMLQPSAVLPLSSATPPWPPSPPQSPPPSPPLPAPSLQSQTHSSESLSQYYPQQPATAPPASPSSPQPPPPSSQLRTPTQSSHVLTSGITTQSHPQQAAAPSQPPPSPLPPPPSPPQQNPPYPQPHQSPNSTPSNSTPPNSTPSNEAKHPSHVSVQPSSPNPSSQSIHKPSQSPQSAPTSQSQPQPYAPSAPPSSSFRFVAPGQSPAPSQISLQLASDLHLECPHDLPFHKILKPKARLLALAGDIGSPFDPKLELFLKWCSDRFQHVLYVAGNHEYYNLHNLGINFTVTQIDAMLEDLCGKFPNVHYLNNKMMVLGSHAFIGSTLWSKVPETHRALVQRKMDTYRYVYTTADQLITVHGTNAAFEVNKAFIEHSVQAAVERHLVPIVLTHYTPSLAWTSDPRHSHPNKQDPAFEKKWLNTICAYSTQMAADPGVIRLWCCGHTHYNFRHCEEGYELVSNQWGYHDEGACGYDRELVINI